MKYIVELLVVMSMFINQIQFLLFSMAGIEYDQDSGTGLVSIVNVSFFTICVLWVTWKEMSQKSGRKVYWPYLLMALVIFTFFVESALNLQVTFESFAGRQFFFLVHCFPEFPDFFSEVRYIGAENARSSRHKNAGSTGTQRRAVLLRNVSVHF